jgi:hypothetical protein
MQVNTYIDSTLNTFFQVDHRTKTFGWNQLGRELAYPDGLPCVTEVPENASYQYDLPKSYAPLTVINALLTQKQNRNVLRLNNRTSEDLFDSLPNDLYDVLPLAENVAPATPNFMEDFVESVDFHLDTLAEEGYNPNSFLEPKASRIRSVAGRTVGNPMIHSVEMESIPFDPQSIFSPFETYGDEWSFAWWREVFQNSVDAIHFRQQALEREGIYNYKGKIDVTYEEEGDYTKVTIRDNGIGMSKDILYRALLSFGGTGKRGVGGATGGFGKAKELIFVPWLQFQLETTAYDFKRGRAYTTMAKGKHFERQRMDTAMEVEIPESVGSPTFTGIGTTLTVWMGKETLIWVNPETESSYEKETDYRVELEQINPLIKFSYLPHISLTINGESISLKQGPKIVNTIGRGIDSAPQQPAREEYFTNQQHSANLKIYVDKKKDPLINIVMVRQNGMYMFNAGYQPENVKGLVRVECSGSALALYTDSRNALRYQGYISNIISSLATDGVFGLEKRREAVTLVQDGSDISNIQDERIRRLRRNTEVDFESMYSDVARDTEQNIQVDTYRVDITQHRKLMQEGDSRREKLKAIESLVIEQAKRQQEDTAEGIADGDITGTFFGQIDEETLKQFLDKIPVRVTGKQFIENNFWRPKQVIHSTLGPDVIDDKLWIKPDQYPEEYTFRLLDFWTNCVRLCATAIGVPLEGYATGFVVGWDESGNYPVGLFMPNVSGTGQKAILINPTELSPILDEYGDIVYKKGVVKGFTKKQRWKLGNRDDREELLAIAAHEVTHAQGYMQHNDDFAAALTFNMATIFGRGIRMLKHFYDASGERYSSIKQAKKADVEKAQQVKIDLALPLLEKYRPQKGRKKTVKGISLYIVGEGSIPLDIVVTKLQEVSAMVLEIKPSDDYKGETHGIQFPIYMELVPKIVDSHFTSGYFVTFYSYDLPEPLEVEASRTNYIADIVGRYPWAKTQAEHVYVNIDGPQLRIMGIESPRKLYN